MAYSDEVCMVIINYIFYSNRNSKLDKFRGILELVQAVDDDTFQTPRVG